MIIDVFIVANISITVNVFQSRSTLGDGLFSQRLSLAGNVERQVDDWTYTIKAHTLDKNKVKEDDAKMGSKYTEEFQKRSAKRVCEQHGVLETSEKLGVPIKTLYLMAAYRACWDGVSL
jgi:hypothetical protein